VKARSIQAVTTAIGEVARRELLKDFRPDCCIATARTVIRVLRYYGFDAQPLAVRAMIFNPIYAAAFDNGTARTQDDADWKEWMDSVGAWSVGVGYPDGTPGFGGHLVALVSTSSVFFIDASLDQASRPAKGIVLPESIFIPVTREFLITPGEQLVFRHDTGMLLVYERIVNESFRSSPDWKDKTRTKRAMKAIIRHIDLLA
jgi:hypothetical protein